MIAKGLPVSRTEAIHISPEIDSIVWKIYQDKIARGHSINLG